MSGEVPKEAAKGVLDESKPEFDESPVNPEFDKLFSQAMDVEAARMPRKRCGGGADEGSLQS